MTLRGHLETVHGSVRREASGNVGSVAQSAACSADGRIDVPIGCHEETLYTGYESRGGVNRKEAVRRELYSVSGVRRAHCT